MAFEIIETCVNCWACEPLCPSDAIHEARPHFLIDAKKCTECSSKAYNAARQALTGRAA